MKSSSIPSKSKQRQIIQQRQMGVYICEDTLNDATIAFQRRQADDQAFTLLINRGVFNVYNRREFGVQLLQWMDLGAVLLKENINEVTLAGKKAWAFTVQPADMDESIGVNPLALALGIMVSGFTYIAWDKAFADFVFGALNHPNKKCDLCGGNAGKHGHNPAPLKGTAACSDCNRTKVIPARLAEYDADAESD